MYNYDARFYDPVVARWTTIDPLAEISRRWSPYNYVENDPVRLTDPDGMQVNYIIVKMLPVSAYIMLVGMFHPVLE